MAIPLFHRRTMLTGVIFWSLTVLASAAEFRSDWARQHDRIWIGPEYWANPLEDWRLRDGVLECTRPGPNRNVHLLTHQLSDQPGDFELSVHIGLQDVEQGQGSVGFALGIRSELGDYRSSLIHGRPAMEAGVNVNGLYFLGPPGEHATLQAEVPYGNEGSVLKLTGKSLGEGEYELTLTATDFQTLKPRGGPLTIRVKPEGRLAGNIALVNNFAPPAGGGDRAAGNGTRARFWFDDWQVSGSKVVEHPEQSFGPILYSMYTLSRGVMKMTAQMPPLGPEESQSVELQVPLAIAEELRRVNYSLPADMQSCPPPAKDAPQDSPLPADRPVAWSTIARGVIDPLSRTAHFRIPAWPAAKDVPYRLAYRMQTVPTAETGPDSRPDVTEHEWRGVIRRDPVEQETISVAGFTGNTDQAFPNALLVSNVQKHQPDLLFFSGDQIYENVGGYGIIREPVHAATLNYLRKLWLWGWAFRDLLKDRPSVVLPDDHDVYQGNIWGEGGKPVPGGIADHAQGGFVQPPDFVNAVFRTQTGHLSDPFDPTPMLQGIDCWYTDLVYGRIGFAILEDRYFKSGPEKKVNTWRGRPDHLKDPSYDLRLLDRPGLELLGRRQLEFLETWAADWRGTDLKCVLSQTIFCNLANYHGAQQEFVFADLDSNGWPQSGRNAALAALRKGFAFHLAGDQHLASIVHHGIDAFGDAGWSFCVPSIAAGYPRSWRPDAERRPVQNRPPPGVPNTGEYLDGFGNKMTVSAVGNPAEQNRRPVLELLHDKASGYGLVRFHKPTRTIEINCYRLLFDAADEQPGDQFPGWPRTIAQRDNHARRPTGYLPRLVVEGLTTPVVQVWEQQTGRLVYALRLTGPEFSPPVFSEGEYVVRVGEPDEDRWREVRNLRPMPSPQVSGTVTIRWE